MNPEIKERWVAKLRSGDYAQTDGRLADSSGFCCLGVLCEVAVEDGILIKVEDPAESDDVEKTVYKYLDKVEGYGSVAVLPDAVVEWAGLPYYNPYVKVEESNPEMPISDVNDDLKYSFSQIADLIEKQL